MKTRKRLLLILMFVGLVLCLTSTLIEGYADDTYNFYFQKAPGPTVVNQGVAGPTNPADLVVKQGAESPANQAAAQPAASPAPTSAANAKEMEPAPSGPKSWELSIGVANSKYSPGTNPEGYYYSGPSQQYTSSGIINGVQYAVGLQYNFNEHFGFQAEAFRLAKTSANYKGRSVPEKGSLWDYSGGLVVTPIILPLGSSIKLKPAFLVGAISMPFHKSGFSPTGSAEGNPEVGHSGSAYYGLRVGLEFWNRVALQVTGRKIDRFDSTHGTASMALLF